MPIRINLPFAPKPILPHTTLVTTSGTTIIESIRINNLPMNEQKLSTPLPNAESAKPVERNTIAVKIDNNNAIATCQCNLDKKFRIISFIISEMKMYGKY